MMEQRHKKALSDAAKFVLRAVIEAVLAVLINKLMSG
jgi:hypothetical protein